MTHIDAYELLERLAKWHGIGKAGAGNREEFRKLARTLETQPAPTRLIGDAARCVAEVLRQAADAYQRLEDAIAQEKQVVRESLSLKDVTEVDLDEARERLRAREAQQKPARAATVASWASSTTTAI